MPNSQLITASPAHNPNDNSVYVSTVTPTSILPPTGDGVIRNKGNFNTPDTSFTEDVRRVKDWAMRLLPSSNLHPIINVITAKTALDGSQDATWEFRNFFTGTDNGSQNFTCMPTVAMDAVKGGKEKLIPISLPWLSCEVSSKDTIHLHYRLPSIGEVRHWYDGLAAQGIQDIKNVFFNRVTLTVADKNHPDQKQQSPTFSLTQYARSDEDKIYPIVELPEPIKQWSFLGIVGAAALGVIAGFTACCTVVTCATCAAAEIIRIKKPRITESSYEPVAESAAWSRFEGEEENGLNLRQNKDANISSSALSKSPSEKDLAAHTTRLSLDAPPSMKPSEEKQEFITIELGELRTTPPITAVERLAAERRNSSSIERAALGNL